MYHFILKVCLLQSISLIFRHLSLITCEAVQPRMQMNTLQKLLHLIGSVCICLHVLLLKSTFIYTPNTHRHTHKSKISIQAPAPQQMGHICIFIIFPFSCLSTGSCMAGFDVFVFCLPLAVGLILKQLPETSSQLSFIPTGHSFISSLPCLFLTLLPTLCSLSSLRLRVTPADLRCATNCRLAEALIRNDLAS